jgi:hypothetical protein
VLGTVAVLALAASAVLQPTEHRNLRKVFEKKSTSTRVIVVAGNTKEGSITVPLTSCLTGLESAV